MDLDGWFVDNQTGEQIMNPSKPQILLEQPDLRKIDPKLLKRIAEYACCRDDEGLAMCQLNHEERVEAVIAKCEQYKKESINGVHCSDPRFEALRSSDRLGKCSDEQIQDFATTCGITYKRSRKGGISGEVMVMLKEAKTKAVLLRPIMIEGLSGGKNKPDNKSRGRLAILCDNIVAAQKCQEICSDVRPDYNRNELARALGQDPLVNGQLTQARFEELKSLLENGEEERQRAKRPRYHWLPAHLSQKQPDSSLPSAPSSLLPPLDEHSKKSKSSKSRPTPKATPSSSSKSSSQQPPAQPAAETVQPKLKRKKRTLDEPPASTSSSSMPSDQQAATASSSKSATTRKVRLAKGLKFVSKAALMQAFNSCVPTEQNWTWEPSSSSSKHHLRMWCSASGPRRKLCKVAVLATADDQDVWTILSFVTDHAMHDAGESASNNLDVSVPVSSLATASSSSAPPSLTKDPTPQPSQSSTDASAQRDLANFLQRCLKPELAEKAALLFISQSMTVYDMDEGFAEYLQSDMCDRGELSAPEWFLVKKNLVKLLNGGPENKKRKVGTL